MKELLILIEYLNKKLIFLLKAKDNLIRKYLTLEILFNLYIYIFNLRSCFFLTLNTWILFFINTSWK